MLRRMRSVLPVVMTTLLSSLAFAHAARADEKTEAFPIGHLMFGMGGASGGPTHQPFRAGLDASVGVLIGDSNTGSVWTVAPSLITGLGKYPTYASLDLGRSLFGAGQFSAYTGLALTGGPVFRVDPSTGAGGEVCVRVWFVIAQAGVRAIAIVTNGPEVQIEGLVGVGFM